MLDFEYNADSNGDTDGQSDNYKSQKQCKTKKQNKYRKFDIEETDQEDVNEDESEELSDENVEEYDSEEEEDEEEEERPRKKRKSRYNAFFIDEAEVDNDCEDEEEWEDGAQELGIDVHEVDEVGPTAREIEGRQRGHSLWESQKEEEIEDYFRKKYASSPTTKRNFGDGKNMSLEIEQQTLLPSVKDPNLWMVKCQIGEEKSTALLLMRKYITYEYENMPLQIKSVIVPEGVKGFIYFEAFKQPHVKIAMDGVRNLKLGQWSQKMVPVKEMTDILRVMKTDIGLKPKQWVRPKRGIYKNDIAQVDFVDVVQNIVHLKLIPRINYGKKRGALRTVDEDDEDASSNKRKRNSRPPAKLFDPELVRTVGGEINADGDFLLFEGGRYSTKGFLYKSFKCNAVITESVKPTLAELEIFEETPEEVMLELSEYQTKEKDIARNFNTGDVVEVCSGELTNLQGKIISVDGNKVTIMPSHAKLLEPLEFNASDIKKHFTLGDHVKVIAGKYSGDTGLIINVKENHVVVFSDLSMHEIEILICDIQLCADVTTGVDSMGHFQWGDLVSIDEQTVGIIIRMGSDTFQVLSMHGKIVNVQPQSLTIIGKRMHSRALDSQQNVIECNNFVQVVDGRHSGRTGKIKYLYRGFAFVQAQKHVENGGFIVCKARHLELKGGSKIPQLSAMTNSNLDMSPTMTETSFKVASPYHSNSNVTDKKQTSGYIKNYNGNRNDRGLIGAIVKIIRGPYKGREGYCKSANEATVRVELFSPLETIIVNRINVINISEPNKPENISSTPGYHNPTNRPIGSKTPMYGSNNVMTPMYDNGCCTPHYSPLTPQHDGSRTPNQNNAWDPSITNTPARSNDSDFSPNISSNSFNQNYNFSYAPTQTTGTSVKAAKFVRRLPRKKTANFSQPSKVTQKENWDEDETTSQPNVGYSRQQVNETENWDEDETTSQPNAGCFRQQVNVTENWDEDETNTQSNAGCFRQQVNVTENWDEDETNTQSNAGCFRQQVNESENWDEEINDPPTNIMTSVSKCHVKTLDINTDNKLINSTEDWDAEDEFLTPLNTDDSYSTRTCNKRTEYSLSIDVSQQLKKPGYNNKKHKWLEKNLQVLIKDSYDDWDLAGQAVIINNISGNMCNALVVLTNTTVNINCDEVVPCLPDSGQRVKIVKGEFCGKYGILEKINTTEGIIKIDSEGTQSIPTSYLCKMH